MLKQYGCIKISGGVCYTLYPYWNYKTDRPGVLDLSEFAFDFNKVK